MAPPGWDIRVDKPELLTRIEELAAARGITTAEVVEEALERFVADRQ